VPVFESQARDRAKESTALLSLSTGFRFVNGHGPDGTYYELSVDSLMGTSDKLGNETRLSETPGTRRQATAQEKEKRFPHRITIHNPHRTLR